MEEEKQIEATGSDSTEKHQNAPPLIDELHGDEEGCSFEVSSIRLSDDQDETPLEEEEEVPKLSIVRPDSPFRSRWVKGMQNTNKSFGSAHVLSPVTKYTPASVEHSASEIARDFDVSEIAQELKNLDRSALDASVVTNSLLESSFLGPDSTNARLEAAYMWTKRENNSLLQKVKELEEAAAAREQAKLVQMMTGIDSGSPLKWAKNMIGKTSPEESQTDDEPATKTEWNRGLEPRTQLLPTELNDLALPTLSPTTINTELNFEETAEPPIIEEKKPTPSPFRRMIVLFLLALGCSILLAHKGRVEVVLKETISKAAPILKEHEEVFNNIAKQFSDARELVDAKLQPAKEFLMPHIESAIVFSRHKYEHYSAVAASDLEKLELLLGLKLDFESDILPMAKNYMGKEVDAPLEGINVVVVRASTNVGRELVHVFSRLGARVLAVDGSVKHLASIKASSRVDTMKVDFNDLVSVAKVAVDIAESFGHIDILVNCVNGYSRDFGETKQGYDKHFGVNYLSEYLLTTKLMEPLSKSSKGTLVHLDSMAHILVDGSDLQVQDEAGPFVSVPGDVNNLLAYSSSVLASRLHYQHLQQTQEKVRVVSVMSTPFIPAMSARVVLASVFLEEETSMTTESVHAWLQQAKQKLGVFGEFANPFQDEQMLEGLMAWSHDAVSPYWWTKLEPSPHILQPTCLLPETSPSYEEASEFNAFYASSVATLLSVGSWSILRQFMKRE